MNDGFATFQLAGDEADERQSGDGSRPSYPGGGEPVRLLPLVEHELQCSQPESHQAEAEIVDCPLEFVAEIRRVLDVQVDHEERQDADGEIDVENPAPGVAVGDPTAEGGADDGGDDDAEAKDGHGGAVLAGRKALQQDGLGQRLHSAAANALQNAGHDQHGHGYGHATEQRGDSEDEDGNEQQPRAADAPRQPSSGGQHDGSGVEVAGENTAELIGG